MLIVSGRIVLREGKREEFLNASRDAMMQARKAKGCRQFVIAADPIDADVANVYEEWESENDLLTFRSGGPSADMRAAIASADVKRHEISRSTTA